MSPQAVASNFELDGRIFLQLPEAMSEFNFECSKTKRGFYNRSIQCSGSGAMFQIHGIEKTKGKISTATRVAVSEKSLNKPKTIMPISKFQHAEILVKCLKKITSN